MDLNRDLEVRGLLTQMLSDKLTSEEKSSLREYIQSTYKDDELDVLMREHWIGLKNMEIVEEDEQFLLLKKQLFSRIKKTTKTVKKERRLFPFKWTENFMRVAAILFIPLLLGSIFVIYQLNMQKNSPMAMQQVIATPGSRVHFSLPDHSEVWLNSGSTLEFPVNLDKLDQRKVKLIGQGYFKVAHDKKHPFFVETQDMSIKALGTAFDVSSYAIDRITGTTLEEGSVAIYSLQGEKVGILNPGQRAILDRSTTKWEIKDVETILTTSWKDGKLIFRNTSLPDLTIQLERWFNCTIHVDPKLLKSNLTYTATIQNETLSEVLSMIEISTAVKTKINNREVFIYPKK